MERREKRGAKRWNGKRVRKEGMGIGSS